MKKRILNLLKIIVTLIGLGIVIVQVHPIEVARTLTQVHLGWALVAFLLVAVSLVIRAYRWYILVTSLDVKIKFRRLAELYFVGNFFNAFLLSGFGGDVVRALEAARDVPGNVAAGTVILDRLSGLVMLFLMSLLVSPLYFGVLPTPLFSVIFLGSVAGVVGGFILLEGSLIRRFGGWLPGPLSPTGSGPIARLLQAVQGCGWRAVAGALGVSALFNLILSGWWLAAGLALGESSIPYTYYILVMPLLSVPLLLPSISGLGPREALAPTLFAAAGMAAATAVSLSFLVFIVMRMGSLLGGPIYIATVIRDGRVRPMSQPEHEVKL